MPTPTCPDDIAFCQTSCCALVACPSRRSTARAILETWRQVQLPRISGKSELAKAIRYPLARMSKVRDYLDHGVLELDNNTAE